MPQKFLVVQYTDGSFRFVQTEFEPDGQRHDWLNDRRLKDPERKMESVYLLKPCTYHGTRLLTLWINEAEFKDRKCTCFS